MINNELLDYVQKAIEAGQTNEQINAALLQQGWSSEDVNEAIAQVSVASVEGKREGKLQPIQANQSRLPRWSLPVILLLILTLTGGYALAKRAGVFKSVSISGTSSNNQPTQQSSTNSQGQTSTLSPQNTFPIWKTIKIGTGFKTADDFRKALNDGGFQIGTYGNDILGRPAFTVSPIPKEIELVQVSVADLGFKDGATQKDFYQRAAQLGLMLCPAEVGPQLLMQQYKDKPAGLSLFIAMEPITGSDGFPYVFYIYSFAANKMWFDAQRLFPGVPWMPVARWVFCRTSGP